MRIFWVILSLCLFFVGSAQAEMLLTGEVQYTTESARNELLNNDAQKPDGEKILLNIVDENYNENKTLLLKSNAAIKDRTLALFSDNSYAVKYKDNPLYVWYYSSEGVLTHIEVNDGTEYPYKSYKYDVEGKLVNMGLRVSKAETFMFTPSGKLIAHWLKDKGYDENGKVIMKRRYKE